MGVFAFALLGLALGPSAPDQAAATDPALIVTPLVAHGDTWRYHKGTNAPLALWKTAPETDLDDTWPSGPGGFGYGDKDDATVLSDMINGYSTVFLRRSFTVAKPLDAQHQLQLIMDWDDGFIAWLDGIEIARSDNVLEPEPAFTAFSSPPSHEASAGDNNPNPPTVYELGPAADRFGPGTHVLAIMGLNASLNNADFTLIGDLNLLAPPISPVPMIASMADDTGRSATDGITKNNTLLLSGIAEANSTVTLLLAGVEIGATKANGSGEWTFDYTSTTLPEGTYEFTATATDAAGNTSPASAPFAVTIDITRPAAPVITGVAEDTGSSAGDRITEDATLVFRGTAEADSTGMLYKLGTPIGTTQANGSGAWTFDYTGTTLPEGYSQFTATATDAAGNTSPASASFTVAIDATAPTITGFSAVPANRYYQAGQNLDFTLTYSEGVLVDTTGGTPSLVLILDWGSRNAAYLSGSGTAALRFRYVTQTGDTAAGGLALSPALALNGGTIQDLAGNAAGNDLGFLPSLTGVLVDATAPAAPVITGILDDTGSSAHDGITQETTLVFQGTAEANSTVHFYQSGAWIGRVSADGNGNWSFDYTGHLLSVGTYAFTATTTDAAWNTSLGSVPFTVTVDTTAPTAPVITGLADDTGSSATDRVTKDRGLVFQGTAEADTTVTLYNSGNSIGIASVNGSGNWSLSYAGSTLCDGTYAFAATATDAAGNASPVSADFTVTIDTTPPALTFTGIITDGGRSATDQVTSDTTLVLKGTAESNLTVTLYWTDLDHATGQALVDESGTWTFDYTGTPLAEGSHVFLATVSDPAGNSATAMMNVTIETPVTVTEITLAADTLWNGATGPIRLTNDWIVPAGVTLSIQDGATVLLESNVCLRVEDGGELTILGTEADPVRLGPALPNRWGQVSVEGPKASLTVFHGDISGTQITAANGARAQFEDTVIHDFPGSAAGVPSGAPVVLAQSAGQVFARRCQFRRYDTCVLEQAYFWLEDSLFETIGGNALEVRAGPPTAGIQRCTFRHGRGGAVVVGSDGSNPSAHIQIDHCLVYDFAAAGISIGDAAQTVLAANCLIYNCQWGIEVSDSSSALLYNNTIAHCETGFQIHEKIPGRGSGLPGDTFNNLLWGNVNAISLLDGGHLSVTYTGLPDTSWTADATNLADDPQFVNFSGHDYRLRGSSPMRGRGRNGEDLGAAMPVGAFMASSHPAFALVEDIDPLNLSFSYWSDPEKHYAIEACEEPGSGLWVKIADLPSTAMPQLITLALPKGGRVQFFRLVSSELP